MVLTDAHLDRAHDLRDWSIEDVGHGRHGSGSRFPRPPSWPGRGLTSATLILTLDDIESNPPPSPG